MPPTLPMQWLLEIRPMESRYTFLMWLDVVCISVKLGSCFESVYFNYLLKLLTVSFGFLGKMFTKKTEQKATLNRFLIVELGKV